MAISSVAPSFFNATSSTHHHPVNSLALFAGAALTTLALGGSLIYYRLKAHPLPAYFELGQEAFQKGQFEKALEHYDNAFKFGQVSAAKIYYEKGSAYLEMKDYEAAWENCKRALTKLQDARSPLDPPLDPNLSPQVLCLKAELCLVQDEKRQAIIECQKVLSSHPTDRKLLMRTHLILALAHYHSQNPLGAMEHCNKAISNNDSQAMGAILSYNQAMCYIMQGNPQYAHNSLEWAQVGLNTLTFASSFLRLVMPLPSEWRVKIDSTLSLSQQLSQRINEAFNRTNPPCSPPC
jgi:tetratricopeptide (TPR) repeat protein